MRYFYFREFEGFTFYIKKGFTLDFVTGKSFLTSGLSYRVVAGVVAGAAVVGEGVLTGVAVPGSVVPGTTVAVVVDPEPASVGVPAVGDGVTLGSGVKGLLVTSILGGGVGGVV